jgi:hypothetical protein
MDSESVGKGTKRFGGEVRSVCHDPEYDHPVVREHTELDRTVPHAPGRGQLTIEKTVARDQTLGNATPWTTMTAKTSPPAAKPRCICPAFTTTPGTTRGTVTASVVTLRNGERRRSGRSALRFVRAAAGERLGVQKPCGPGTRSLPNSLFGSEPLIVLLAFVGRRRAR